MSTQPTKQDIEMIHGFLRQVNAMLAPLKPLFAVLAPLQKVIDVADALGVDRFTALVQECAIDRERLITALNECTRAICDAKNPIELKGSVVLDGKTIGDFFAKAKDSVDTPDTIVKGGNAERQCVHLVNGTENGTQDVWGDVWESRHGGWVGVCSARNVIVTGCGSPEQAMHVLRKLVLGELVHGEPGLRVISGAKLLTETSEESLTLANPLPVVYGDGSNGSVTWTDTASGRRFTAHRNGMESFGGHTSVTDAVNAMSAMIARQIGRG